MNRLEGSWRQCRHWLRAIVATVGAIGLLGAAARVEARVVRERTILEARVESVRQAGKLPSGEDASGKDEDQTLAQWLNWPNFKNWPNWNKWNNWGNWFNR